MISTFLFPFIIIQAIAVSSKQFLSLNTSNAPRPPSLTEDYLYGCIAILEGKDDINSDQDPSYTYSEWESQSSSGSLFDYLDNKRGVTLKYWTSDTDSVESWVFDLILYDGDYVDQKFILVRVDIRVVSGEMDINQDNGTFTGSQVIQVEYGENNIINSSNFTCIFVLLNIIISNPSDVKGQLSMYFVNADTQQPITDFDEYDTNIQGDTLQMNFVSDDGSLTFTTSLFSKTYQITTGQIVLVSVLTFFYTLATICSPGIEELRDMVSFKSAMFSFGSSAYIAVWIYLHIQVKTSFSLYIPFIGALIDLLKHAHFLAKKDQENGCSGILFMAFVAYILNMLPNIWINLFPSLVLFIPLLSKLQNSEECHFNIFQISNWICALLWMGYCYLCPNNIFLISPNLFLAPTFFFIIFLQVALAINLRKNHNHNNRPRPRPQFTPRRPTSPLLPPQNPAAPPLNVTNITNVNIINQVVSINHQQKEKHKYSFAESGEDGYTLLTDECVICSDLLLGEETKKLYKTPCSHIFHETCLRVWGQQKLECPTCRKKLPDFRHSIN